MDSKSYNQPRAELKKIIETLQEEEVDALLQIYKLKQWDFSIPNLKNFHNCSQRMMLESHDGNDSYISQQEKLQKLYKEKLKNISDKRLQATKELKNLIDCSEPLLITKILNTLSNFKAYDEFYIQLRQEISNTGKNIKRNQKDQIIKDFLIPQLTSYENYIKHLKEKGTKESKQGKTNWINRNNLKQALDLDLQKYPQDTAKLSNAQKQKIFKLIDDYIKEKKNDIKYLSAISINIEEKEELWSSYIKSTFYNKGYWKNSNNLYRDVKQYLKRNKNLRPLDYFMPSFTNPSFKFLVMYLQSKNEQSLL